MKRVEQMIFRKDPQYRECKVTEKTDMNDIQGTGEGTVSGRTIETPKIAFNQG